MEHKIEGESRKSIDRPARNTYNKSKEDKRSIPKRQRQQKEPMGNVFRRSKL